MANTADWPAPASVSTHCRIHRSWHTFAGSRFLHGCARGPPYGAVVNPPSGQPAMLERLRHLGGCVVRPAPGCPALPPAGCLDGCVVRPAGPVTVGHRGSVPDPARGRFALSGRRVLSRARISPTSGEILAPVPPPGLVSRAPQPAQVPPAWRIGQMGNPSGDTADSRGRWWGRSSRGCRWCAETDPPRHRRRAK